MLHAACLLPPELGFLQTKYLDILRKTQPDATAFSHLRGQLPVPPLFQHDDLIRQSLADLAELKEKLKLSKADPQPPQPPGPAAPLGGEPLAGSGAQPASSPLPAPPPGPNVAADSDAEVVQLEGLLHRLLALLGGEAAALVLAKVGGRAAVGVL